MMWQMNRSILITGAGLVLATAAFGQAGPGPITPPPQPASSEDAPPPVAKRVQVAPRKSLAGDWQLNKEDSDDPHQRVQRAHGGSATPNNGPNMGGGGWPGNGWPGGGPYGGNRGNRVPQGDPGASEKAKMQELVDPTIRLNVEQKDPKAAEIVLTGDQSRKTILYTDGRTLDPPAKDKKEPRQGPEELLARWEGSKLVTDEKVGKNGSLTKAYELSPDGLQLFEDVHLTLGKKNTDVTIHYVYDAVNVAE
jgi:hypothetical protein